VLLSSRRQGALRIAAGYVLENGRILLEENAEDLLANRDCNAPIWGAIWTRNRIDA